jgi:hypothetical protein
MLASNSPSACLSALPATRPWLSTEGKFRLIAALALVVSLFETTIFLDKITGLHGDEAWVILHASEVSLGTHPLPGMNLSALLNTVSVFLYWL